MESELGHSLTPSESSESAAQAVFIGTLQGLTCEKKTESILVKAADLDSE